MKDKWKEIPTTHYAYSIIDGSVRYKNLKTDNVLGKSSIHIKVKGKRHNLRTIMKENGVNVECLTGKHMLGKSHCTGKENSSKWWLYIPPKGEFKRVYNLKKFCRENDLHYLNLINTSYDGSYLPCGSAVRKMETVSSIREVTYAY